MNLQQFKESILMGHEIEMTICGIPVFIGCARSGTPQSIPHTVYNEMTQELLCFPSRDDLWNSYRFHGKSLEQLWVNDIEIKSIF